MSAIRLLVVDDDALVRQAYSLFFSRTEEFEIVGQACNGSEGIDLYGQLHPDVVLMDLQMPVLGGTDATREITTRWPEAVVVILTTFSTREHVVAALQAGAAGYLVKDAGADGLTAGIRQALAGDMPLSARIRQELVSAVRTAPAPPPTSSVELTPREHELVKWVARGLTNQEIATKMYISQGSVKQYLGQVSNKMGVRSRTQVIIKAVRAGLLSNADLAVD